MNNKSGSERLKAWVHWKLLEKDLNDDDKQFALDIQDLQKLCEEQKGELEANAKMMAESVALHGFSQRPCGHLVANHQSLCPGCQIESQLTEQKAEIERLKKALGVDHTIVCADSVHHIQKLEWKLATLESERLGLATKNHDLQTDLAEQTERVRIAKEALEEIAQSVGCLPQYSRIDAQQTATTALQALNQESLGDGK